MNIMLRTLIVTLGVLFLVGFAAGPKTESSTAVETVWIEKSDGSVSCESGSGEPTEKVAAQLKSAGVEVIKNKKGNDGLIRVQVCGIETGNLNQIQIRKSDLEKAKALGFVLSKQ